MIRIKTTPNLFGISLQGDYEDLNNLYDSINRYLDFYCKKIFPKYPYHEGEYLLSLNYDIRHAYMGARDIETVENNADSIGVHADMIYELSDGVRNEFKKRRRTFKDGNLYFSVNILYPLIFHYLSAFELILDDDLEEAYFTETSEEDAPWLSKYSMIDAVAHRAQIRLFTSLIWENIQTLLGEDKATAIYNYFTNAEVYPPHSIYCDALLQYQVANFCQMSKEEKLAFLELALFEILDSEDLRLSSSDYPVCAGSYKKQLAMLEKNTDYPSFPTKVLFFKKLDAEYVIKEGAIYRDDFETFLEKNYGKSVQEEPDW